MKDIGQETTRVAALQHAAPYIRLFQGKTFVVKAGGGAVASDAARRALVAQVDLLFRLGIRVVLVHGGRRPPVLRDGERVDYGHVGDVAAVDPGVLETLLDAHLVPVVAPLSADDSGALLNVNADTVASHLAVALGAEKLILLTGAPGILERPNDPGSLVSYTDLPGLQRLRAAGCLERGMLPKAESVEAAIVGGVRRVHILSESLPDGLLAEVFTNEGVGTLVVESIQALSPAERGVA